MGSARLFFILVFNIVDMLYNDTKQSYFWKATSNIKFGLQENYYKESNDYFVKLINVFCSITTHTAQKVCNLQCTNLFEAHIIISQWISCYHEIGSRIFKNV